MRFIDFKLTEATLGGSTPSSVPAYINAVNELLKNPNYRFPIGKDGNEGMFMPLPGQQVSSLTNQITGYMVQNENQKLSAAYLQSLKSLDAATLQSALDKQVPITLMQIVKANIPNVSQLAQKELETRKYRVKVSQLYKSKDIKQASGFADMNKGEVSEGYHAAAAFARLIKRPSENITGADVINVVSKLENGQTYVLNANEVDNPIADEFHITVSLKPQQWEAFKNPKTATALGGIFNSIVQDANKETAKFAEKYASNNRFDYVRVIGDGVSGETETKTDVKFENETEKKFAEYSLKVGTTKQIHQVGGGAVKGNRAVSMEARYDILQNELFGVHGIFQIADISAIKEKFLMANDADTAQEIAYKEAVRSLNEKLKSDDSEKSFLQGFARALKYWMVRNDDEIKLKQFTDSGTYVLDAKKLNNLHQKNDLDLVAQYKEDAANPKIVILDRISKKPLVSIRTYKTSSGYIRNYLEKEKLFTELTNIVKQS